MSVALVCAACGGTSTAVESARALEGGAEAVATYEGFLERGELTEVERVEVHAQLARLYFEERGEGWEGAFERHAWAVDELWGAHGSSIGSREKDRSTGRTVREQTLGFVARTRFLQAEREREVFEELELSFPIATFRRLAKQKGELEQRAEKTYFEVVELVREERGTPSAKWAVASLYRIGQMYEHMGESLYGNRGVGSKGELEGIEAQMLRKSLRAYGMGHLLARELESSGHEWHVRLSAEYRVVAERLGAQDADIEAFTMDGPMPWGTGVDEDPRGEPIHPVRSGD